MGTPRYKGEREFIQELGGFRLSTDEVFGLDIGEQTYMGTPARARAFINSFKTGQQILTGGNSKMYLTGRRVRDVGPYTRITLIGEGTWDGKERDPVITRSIQVQSASLATDNEEDGTIQVSYRAQVVTLRYFVLGTAPLNPRGAGFLPSNLQATPFNPNPARFAGRLQFKFAARNVLFETEDVVDQKLYRVTEQQVLEIVPT